MLLAEEQKQQDIFYEEFWEIDYPTDLLHQIYKAVDKKIIPTEGSLEEKVQYLIEENTRYKDILFTLVSKLNSLEDINQVLTTDIRMITK